jgi:YrbI family 3-deoxy-D-manno-octulosonate 8-phosphate phosphatase
MTKQIKLFVTDVDGTLTDGGMFYTEQGDEFKRFNAHDGMAIQLLREQGIKTAFITKENTSIVERRAKKLKVDYLYQGVDDKLKTIKAICTENNFTLSEVAYIGDDVNDAEALTHVGLRACPANAVKAVKEIDKIIILQKNGGYGAVREFAEIILNQSYES